MVEKSVLENSLLFIKMDEMITNLEGLKVYEVTMWM